MLRASEVIAKLNKLPGEKQFLEGYSFEANGSSFVADLLMIHESGIYLFKFFPEPGLYTGNELHYSWKFSPADGSGLRQITNPYIDQVNLGNAFKAFTDELFACRLFCYDVFNTASSFSGDNAGIVGSRLVRLIDLDDVVSREMEASGKCYDAAGLKKIYSALTAKPAEEKKAPSKAKAAKKKKTSGRNKKKPSVDVSDSYKPKKNFHFAPLLAVLIIGFGVYYAVKTVNKDVEDKKEELAAVVTAEAASSDKPVETVPASVTPTKIEPEYRKFGDEPNTLIVHNDADVSCQVFLLDGNDENVLVFRVPSGVYEVNIPVGTWRTILAFEGSGPVDYGDIVSVWDAKEPIEIFIVKS